MPSLIPGFECDVFISYRQNDNRSGWVTEFVSNLKEELAATIKEPVSIYFDSNPYDGLLETHDVEKSLQGKLNCLILIPIISQTYCDIKSFAWQNEFVAFNKKSKEDQIGGDIELINGNVTSRILPVKIHDLDTEDKNLIQTELGGAIRAIDFIYKEPGVNRPLKVHDKEKKNLNGTKYRNQVNKVANAVKEIITALKSPTSRKVVQENDTYSRPPIELKKGSKKKALFTIAGILILLALIYGAFQFKGSTYQEPEVLDKSIAVLPFVNMSNDPNQEYFSDGLSEELLNLLSKIPELKVIGRTSSFSFKGKNEDLRVIGEKLGVAHILEGSVQKEGNKIRVTAQLIRTADGSHLWSERYEREIKGIFKLQDDIAGSVVKQLKLELLAPANGDSSSINTDVYNLILQGNFFVEKRDEEDLAKALDFYRQALAIDSLNARTWAAVAKCYELQANWDWIDHRQGIQQAKEAAIKSIELDDNLAEGHEILGKVRMYNDLDWEGAESEFQKALSIDPGNADVLRDIGTFNRCMGRFEEAIQFFNQSISRDPVKPVTYFSFGRVLYSTNRFSDAVSAFKKVLELNPEFPHTHYYLSLVYLQQGIPEGALNEIQQETDEEWRNLVLILSHHALGRKTEANTLLSDYIVRFQDRQFHIAEIYSYLGEKDKAFDWLEKAYAHKDASLHNLKGDPLLKNLEGDPRHTAFLKKMKLPL